MRCQSQAVCVMPLSINHKASLLSDTIKQFLTFFLFSFSFVFCIIPIPIIMNSEAVHSSQVNENEQYQPQNGVLQQEEQQSDPEKKSVLNKVKAKAKKIKDSIKKHGQQVLDQYGRENSSNEDQNSPVGHDMDEDEKFSQDQPVDESDKNVPPTFEQVEDFVKSAAPESEEVNNLDKSEVDSGRGKTVMGEELHQEPRVIGASPIITYETNENIGTEQGKTFTEEEMPGNLEKPRGFDEEGSRPEAYTPPNYQTKSTDLTTGTVDVNDDVKTVPPSFEQVEKFVEFAAPASEQVENLDELGVNYGGTISVKGGQTHQEPRIVGASPIMETDKIIATEPAKTFIAGEKKLGQGEINLEGPKDFDEDMHTPERGFEAYTPLSYQTKFNDPTGTGGDEIDITPMEKSFQRMNVQDEPKSVPESKVLSDSGETQYPTAESQGQFVPEPDISSATKIQYPPPGSHDQNLPELWSATETQHPYERSNDQFVPEISTATTETQYLSGGTHDDKFAQDTISASTNTNKENPEVTEQTFNSTTDTVEEQQKYESVEKPSNQNTYTDDKLSTASVIADKSVSAENAEASKLEEEKSEDASKKSSGSTLGYGKNIASSMTEKLAPVYGKVAEVGSAVKSKVSGTRTADNSIRVETDNVGKEQDKGVSVKSYLAEKLKPGEEDKALSEVISQTLYRRKEEPKMVSEDEDRNDVAMVDSSSDAIKKQEIEPVEKEQGKSEESYVNSPGKSVVGKIKGVVGSWFGKSSEENQSSQVAGGEDLAKNKNGGLEVEPVEGERRVQE